MWADCPDVSSVAQFEKHKEDKDLVSEVEGQLKVQV